MILYDNTEDALNILISGVSKHKLYDQFRAPIPSPQTLVVLSISVSVFIPKNLGIVKSLVLNQSTKSGHDNSDQSPKQAQFITLKWIVPWIFFNGSHPSLQSLRAQRLTLHQAPLRRGAPAKWTYINPRFRYKCTCVSVI